MFVLILLKGSIGWVVIVFQIGFGSVITVSLVLSFLILTTRGFILGIFSSFGSSLVVLCSLSKGVFLFET
ncbi:MAG: hypothetical protein COA97_13285 [Flavobacteriales bacterium]|nr:MAG: hypothetical protein COA97_13285 [Flavobacteriales bacterium]